MFLIKKSEAMACTESQKFALEIARKIVGVSQTVVFLVDSGSTIEAHTVCRLLLEHLFNFGALLHSEDHFQELKNHSKGECSRQIKKIYTDPELRENLTDENYQHADEYINDPERANAPKNGLNWEQISKIGNTNSMYVVYKEYSFLYAHSTFMSIIKEVSEEEIDELYINVLTVLNFSSSLLRNKLLNAMN